MEVAVRDMSVVSNHAARMRQRRSGDGNPSLQARGPAAACCSRPPRFFLGGARSSSIRAAAAQGAAWAPLSSREQDVVSSVLEQLHQAKHAILRGGRSSGRDKASTRAQPCMSDAARQQHVWLQQTQRGMLNFMGPAALVPLGDPLMALLDTVTVAQFSGTLQLAAMGPANMLISFLLYTSRALPVAVMSLMAAQLQQPQQQQQQQSAQQGSTTTTTTGSEEAALASAGRYLGGGLAVAVALGVLGAGLLVVGSEALVAATGVREAALVGPAAEYLRIRAVALPAVLLTMVAQSGQLAQKDSLTPCISVGVMVVASLASNLLLVGAMGLGLKGAALSTVAVQYLGAGVLLALVLRRDGHHTKQRQQGRSKVQPSWRMLPQELHALLEHMAPLSLVFTAKNLGYLCISATAAALPTAAMAAHNASYSLWVLLTWALSPVEQACLAFLPTATQRWQQRALAAHVLRLGGGVAVAAGCLLAGLLLGGAGLLVKDAAVQPLMSLVALQATLALSLAGADMAATSINISLGDAPFVAASYAITLAATAGYFAACRAQGWGLSGVWWGLVLFFGIRAVQSTGRVALTLLVPEVGAGEVAAVGSAQVAAAASRLESATQQAQQQQQWQEVRPAPGELQTLQQHQAIKPLAADWQQQQQQQQQELKQQRRQQQDRQQQEQYEHWAVQEAGSQRQVVLREA